jgi:hypothetical protein
VLEYDELDRITAEEQAQRDVLEQQLGGVADELEEDR